MYQHEYLIPRISIQKLRYKLFNSKDQWCALLFQVFPFRNLASGYDQIEEFLLLLQDTLTTSKLKCI